MIQKDGKTYLTMEEAKERSNVRLKENAKKFAENVVKMQKESKNNSYV